MDKMSNRLATYTRLPRENRVILPSITAAKHGFFLTGCLQALCCYRCRTVLRLNDFNTALDCEVIIKSHTPEQCIRIVGLGLSDPVTNQHGDIRQNQIATKTSQHLSTDELIQSDESIESDEENGLSTSTVLCDESLIEHAISIGLDPFSIDRALEQAPSSMEIKSLSRLVEYVFEFEDKIDPLGNREQIENHVHETKRKKRTLTKREKARRLQRMAARGKTDVKPVDDCVENASPEIKALTEELEDLEDDDLCKLCIEEPREVVVLPCGHFLMCRCCAAHQFNCPVCRTTIVRTVAINTEL